MNFFILIVAAVIILCVFLNKISVKVGVPMLMAFILLGMLFGTDGIFKLEFDNYSLVADICTAALIFIMFYGGFGNKYQPGEARSSPSDTAFYRRCVCDCLSYRDFLSFCNRNEAFGWNAHGFGYCIYGCGFGFFGAAFP